MRTRSIGLLVPLGALLLAPALAGGCADPEGGPGNTGGTISTGGGAGTGGRIDAIGGGAASDGASGGATSPGTGSGGTTGASSGGTTTGGAPAGGAPGSGGNPSAGGGPGGGSSGDSSSGGSGGGETSGNPKAPDPSPGCNAGAQTFTVPSGEVGFPDGYDGATPVPVLFAFHGAGGDESTLRSQWGNTPIGEKYLMIYLKSAGSQWVHNADRSRVEATYQAVLENGCVDQNRVFAVGHSSGAQMIVQLLCQDFSGFDAVIPVASSVYCASWDPIPVLNFHGLDDQERCAYGLDDCDGRKDIVPYRTSNGCAETTTPADLDVGAACAATIDPGCVEFQGCSEPTFFCNHNDPQYGTSNHGIPCFATPAMMDFLGRFDP